MPLFQLHHSCLVYNMHTNWWMNLGMLIISVGLAESMSPVIFRHPPIHTQHLSHSYSRDTYVGRLGEGLSPLYRITYFLYFGVVDPLCFRGTFSGIFEM